MEISGIWLLMGLEKPLHSQKLICCYGILQDRNVERGVDDEALACEVLDKKKNKNDPIRVI